jgi:hypothetical protein
MKKLSRIFRQQPVLASAFAVFTTAALLFLGGALYNAVYWAGHEKEPIRPWMTIGYVARSWDLRGPDIDRVAGTPLPQGRPLTIQEIADQRGVSADEVAARVEAAVKQLIAEREKATSQ